MASGNGASSAPAAAVATPGSGQVAAALQGVGSVGGLGSSLPSVPASNPQESQQQRMQAQQQAGIQRMQAQQQQQRLIAQRARAAQQEAAIQQQLQRIQSSIVPQPQRMIVQNGQAMMQSIAVRSSLYPANAGVHYGQQGGMRPAMVNPAAQGRSRAQSPLLGVQRPPVVQRPQGNLRPQQQQLHAQRVQGSPGILPQQQWGNRPPQAQQLQGQARGQPLTPQQQQFLAQQQQLRAQKAPAPVKQNQNQPASIAEPTNRILGKRSIQELVAQVDSREKLEPEVEDALLEIADDFVETVTTFACSLAKHRNSTVLEAKDVLFYLERHWDMKVPGFGGEDYKPFKKQVPSEPHKQRLAVVKKEMV